MSFTRRVIQFTDRAGVSIRVNARVNACKLDKLSVELLLSMSD
jgi:hypothetical protein